MSWCQEVDINLPFFDSVPAYGGWIFMSMSYFSYKVPNIPIIDSFQMRVGLSLLEKLWGDEGRYLGLLPTLKS